jgi:hypothetical protein
MSRIVLDRSAILRVKQDAGKQAVGQMSRQSMAGSKRMAPRSPAHLSGSRKPKPGPRLADSIHLTALKVTPDEVSQDLVSPNDYSMTLHKGSKAHRIQGRNGRPLKFYWRKRVRTATGVRRIRPTQASYFDHVWHPGNKKPVPFLTTPVQVAATQNNFKFKPGRS